MHPLLYLTARQFVNGLKRSLTTPKRLISLIFVFGYYFLFFVRPWSGSRTPASFARTSFHFPFPALGVLDAVIFGVFCVVTTILALGTFSNRSSFRQADVDVLFATPVDPKSVLIFRLVREYLFTLLIPFFLVLVTYRPTTAGLQTLFASMPNKTYAPFAFKAASAMWFLLAMAWVAVRYAVGTFVGRSDLQSDRNQRNVTIASWVLGVGVLTFVGLSLSADPTWGGAYRFAHSLPARIVFFTATAATAGAMAPLEANWLELVLGIAALGSLALIAFKVAVSQVGWMYDQAAARGFDSASARTLQQQGDISGLMAERARKGKLRVGRTTWLHRLRVGGAPALVWKEAVLQSRGLKSVITVMGLYILALNVFPVLLSRNQRSQNIDFGAGYAFLGIQAFGAFMMASTVAQTGYLELLKRVDLQKPLPFPSATIVLAEVVAKAMPGTVVTWASSAVVLAAAPSMFPFVAAAVLAAPTLAILMCATTLAVTLLFPDVDDATQRGFRGLMTLLGMALLGAPAVIAFGLLAAFLNAPPVVAALAFAAINLGLSVLVSTYAGNLYSDYNPSE